MEKFSLFLENIVVKKFIGRPKFIEVMKSGSLLIFM